VKLVIFGDREFAEFAIDPNTQEKYRTGNYEILEYIVESCSSVKEGLITTVISGKARGADKMGEKWAKKRGIPVLPFPADWDTYKLGAGSIRNRQMADIADLGIGFLAPNSIGTVDMIEACRERKVPLLIYHIATGEIEIIRPN